MKCRRWSHKLTKLALYSCSGTQPALSKRDQNRWKGRYPVQPDTRVLVTGTPDPLDIFLFFFYF